LFGLGAFTRIFIIADSSGLAAQLKAKQLVFQRVQAVAGIAIKPGKRISVARSRSVRGFRDTGAGGL
jgi:hypothetical protein